MIPSNYLNAAFLSKATQISSSATNCASLPVVLCPADNTVSGSMSPWWITGSILSVMSNLCMSLTFLSCNWSSRLKLCRRHPLAPLIPFISQTEAPVCRLTKPPREECRTRPIMLFFCAPRFTSYALLHLISLASHLRASRINITAPFSRRNIKQSGGSVSAHHQAAEQKLLYSHSIYSSVIRELLYFVSLKGTVHTTKYVLIAIQRVTQA